MALKLVNIFNEYIVICRHFYFETGNALQSFRSDFVLVWIEQIIHFFIIELYILAADGYFTGTSSLFPFVLDMLKELSDSPWNQPIIRMRLAGWALRNLWHYDLRLLWVCCIFVTFHRICLSRPSLTIGKYGRMKSLNNLLDKKWNLSVFEDGFLCFSFRENMVEFEGFEFTHVCGADLCLVERVQGPVDLQLYSVMFQIHFWPYMLQPSAYLVFKQRPESDGHFDIGKASRRIHLLVILFEIRPTSCFTAQWVYLIHFVTVYKLV